MSVAAKKKNKRKRPPAPEVKQSDEGVVVTYPDRKLRKPGPDRAVTRRTPPPPVRCPYCVEEGREGRSERITGHEGVSYYRCLECCDPERGEPTRFKVIARAGE